MHGNNKRKLCVAIFISNHKNTIFSFYFLFFFYKIRKQEGRTGSAQRGGGGWHQWEWGRWQGKG
jgi:hypothetical protein